MSSYAFGVLIALLVPLSHGLANILDSDFANRHFRSLSVLIFFCQLTKLALLPVIILISPPSFIDAPMGLIVLVIALVEVLYQYPYYQALRHADTSIVTSLFSLGKITVPFVAFFSVGEHLSLLQYAGFFATIVSGAVLTLDVRKSKMNRAFVLMIAVSISLEMQLVLYKYAFEHGGTWGTIAVWSTLFEVLIASMFMLSPRNQIEFVSATKKLKHMGPRFLLTQLMSWIGEQATSYALFLIPVTVCVGIADIQSLAVLSFAALLKHKYPELFHEDIERSNVWQKVLLLSLTAVGTALIIAGGGNHFR